MIACVISLGLDDKSCLTCADSDHMGQTNDEMMHYGKMAIIAATIGPLFWMYRSYHAKKSFKDGLFSPDDLAIDCNFFLGMLESIFLIIYLA